MDKKQIAGDGMVTGYGKIDGRLVFVYAYDFTVVQFLKPAVYFFSCHGSFSLLL